MAQTTEGSAKAAAKRFGMNISDYLAKMANGEKRCTRCKQWKSTNSFGKDFSRFDGKDAACFDCRRVKDRRTTKGRVSAFKGKTHTEETKRKMSEAKKGRANPRRGLPRTGAEKEKISAGIRASEKLMRGSSHYAYKHGEAQRALNDRRRVEYKDWRNSVFVRDNYTCQECGDDKGGNLRAHHIKSFAEHPELRFDVSNGITLCHTCHELKHYKQDSIRNIRKLKRGERLWK